VKLGSCPGWTLTLSGWTLTLYSRRSSQARSGCPVLVNLTGIRRKDSRFSQMPRNKLLDDRCDDRPDLLVRRNMPRTRNACPGSQIQFGPKHASKHIRTDAESGGRADERDRERQASLLFGLSTTTAGVTNASTKPTPVDPQQPVQRRFSLWALRRSHSSRILVHDTKPWRSLRISGRLRPLYLDSWRPPHPACLRRRMDRMKDSAQAPRVTRVQAPFGTL
jgi:hypothetical protein